MIYLIEVSCINTKDVWYGCRSETPEEFAVRLRSPSDDALGRWIYKQGGVYNFKLKTIANYTNQTTALAHANRLISEAMDQDRAINPNLLSINSKRNAPI